MHPPTRPARFRAGHPSGNRLKGLSVDAKIRRASSSSPGIVACAEEGESLPSEELVFSSRRQRSSSSARRKNRRPESMFISNGGSRCLASVPDARLEPEGRARRLVLIASAPGVSLAFGRLSKSPFAMNSGLQPTAFALTSSNARCEIRHPVGLARHARRRGCWRARTMLRQ